jgi:plasmid replication initiation protein
MVSKQNELLPIRHEQDFFIADVFDNAAFKDDIASMEHPIFSLSTKPDTRDLEYKNGNVTVQIKPTSDGLPTIHDKDILLYCGSLLMAEVNKGNIPPKTLHISSHDLLVTTNRMTNGNGYKLLSKALARLHGCVIHTNLETNSEKENSGIHLIENYRIVKSEKAKNRMVSLEITLSDWFYNSVIGKEVLTISRDYFRLRGSVDRRLYEIFRRHCGTNKKEWKISLDKLQAKSGSGSTKRLFRSRLKKAAITDHLPTYSFSVDDKDIITVINRDFIPSLKDTTFVDWENMEGIYPKTYHTVREIISNSGTGWSMEIIKKEFFEYIAKKGEPDNINAAFVGFAQKKTAMQP